jgi:CDP-diacylglycerol--glycerol-3-phosphate 3-phosphatidyltransferase
VSPLVVPAVVLAAVLASMAAYAVARPGLDPDASRKGTRFLLGIGNFLVHWFLWLVTPVERLFVALKLTPDVFNVAGLALGLVSGIALGLGRLELGGWAIALGGLCDIFDGRIARARGLASPYGKFIDSTLDRFVEVFAFLGLVVYFRDRPIGAFLAASTLAGSLLVSYAQARGETVQVSGSGGLMQRAERLVLMFLGCVVDPPVCTWQGWPPGTVVVWILALMAPATFGTAVHRTLWIARRLRG